MQWVLGLEVTISAVKLEILKSLREIYDGLPPLVLFASTLDSSPCPVESPCTPVDI